MITLIASCTLFLSNLISAVYPLIQKTIQLSIKMLSPGIVLMLAPRLRVWWGVPEGKYKEESESSDPQKQGQISSLARRNIGWYLDWSLLENCSIFLPSMTNEVWVISALKLLHSGCSLSHLVVPAESSQGSIFIKLSPRFFTVLLFLKMWLMLSK